jgi:hypothetical protein
LIGTFRKIILIAVQDEASSLFRDILQKALLRVGGKKPIWPWYRGSFVLVAYSGADWQPWITQVVKQGGKGPSVIKMVIEK